MPRIDGLSYPDLSPSEAEEITDTLVNEFNGEVSSEEAFAQSVGHSTANSGAFKGKIADMRKYGLLPSRGIEATDLAFRLANPESAEQENDAKFEMMGNVEILSDLYDHLEGREAPSEFWRIIAEVTEANPKEAREASKDLKPLYDTMLEFDSKLGENKMGSSGGTFSTGEATQAEGLLPWGEQDQEEYDIIVSVEGDEMKFQEMNQANVGVVKAFLDSKLKQQDNSQNSEQLQF